MQQEKDYLKREIQKLNIFLTNLISKIIGINAQNSSNEIQNINENLKEQLDLSFNEIIQLSDKDFYKKIADIHESHLEKIAELIIEFTEQIEKENIQSGLDKHSLLMKSIMTMDYLESKTNTFSMQRSAMKQRATTMYKKNRASKC